MLGTEEEAAGRLCPIPFLIANENGDPRSERFGCVGARCQWWVYCDTDEHEIALVGECAISAMGRKL